MDAPYFNPMMPAGVRAAPVAGKAANLGGEKDFAKYMHRRLNEDAGRSDLLGAGGRRSAGRGAAAEPVKKTAPAEEKAMPAIAGLLEEFMHKLEALSTGIENGPGEWSFTPADADLLRQLGADAGMAEGELAELLQRLEKEGELPLGELFGALSRHFAALAHPAPVTVPETDLPLLQSILSRQGVSVEELQQIADEAVLADGILDLKKFLQALEGLSKDGTGPPVLLTDGEADQLQAMLAAAGATRELQQSLFPERGLSWDRAFQPEGPVHIGLRRLQSMLRQAISQVEAGRPEADLPAFFADLDQVLAESGFKGSGTGWSPAVQETVRGMYDQLLASVDLSKVRIEAPPPQPKLALSKAQDKADSEQAEGEEVLFGMEGEEDDSLSLRTAQASGNGRGEAEGKSGQLVQLAAAGGKKVQAGEAQPGSTFSVADPGTAEANPRAEAARTPPHGPRLAPQVQQQTLDQLAAGVNRALSNNEHHFVIRLHPRELGEVKVEVLVRNEQVSLAFSMEDSRVKEVLENNMGRFRDNLEQQGMVLGECMVSVDQQDDSGEAWQRFVQAWKEQQGKNRLVENGGRDPQELLSRAFNRPSRENGFNIII